MIISSSSPLVDEPRTTWAGDATPIDAPPATGTIFSSAVNLAACAFGASMLSLPYAMQLSGPIAALAVLLLFSVMAFFAAQGVLAAGATANKSSYAEIVRHYFGPAQGMIVNGLLAIALLVAAISYIVGLADLLPDIIPPTESLIRPVRIILTLLLLFPLTLITSLATFGPASAIASGGCYILALSLVVQLFLPSSDTPWKSPPVSVWTSVHPMGIVASLPMICFVYAFHYVLTDTIVELDAPTLTRTSRVNLVAIALLLGCYLPVAIAAYLLKSGTDIASNVLAGMSPASPTALIAKWVIAALLFITYSLFLIPLRRKLEISFLGHLTQSYASPMRVAAAASLNLLVGGVSIALPDLGLANTLAGGCIALIMFFYPGRLILRLQLDKRSSERDILTLAIGAVFVFFGGLICVVGLFGQFLF